MTDHLGERDDSDQRDEYDTGARIAPAPAFFLGTLAGLLALGMVWTFVAVAGSSGAEAGTPRARATRVVTVLGTEQTRTSDQRVEECHRAWQAQQQPLRAAASTLDQWKVHVGAMNRLVVGAISLRQANAFWNQTRVGASRRLVGFLAAERDWEADPATCPPPYVAADGPTKLRDCSRAVDARTKTIAAAHVAAKTWQHHVADMEMLRMGHLSPAKATRMWLSSWHRGVAELRSYSRATRASSGLHC